MTREEAIEFAEHAVNLTDIPEVKEFYRMSAAALRPVSREQVEKMWRGKWIHAMPILGSGDEEIRCPKCGNLVAFETDFCQYCGAPMTDEAVDMVMEGLEVLYGDR